MNLLDAAKTKAKTGDMTGSLTDVNTAIAVVQTAVDDGLLDPTRGTRIINNLESKADIVENLSN